MKKIAAGILACLMSASLSSAQKATQDKEGKTRAVIGLSSIYMRQQPDYESALETQELMGTIVEIVGEKSYWREIISPQPYRAWATEKGLVVMSEEELEKYEAAKKVMFIDLYGHVHIEPSLKSATVCDLVGGDIMRLADEEKAYGSAETRLKGKWTKILLPSGLQGFVLTESLRPHKGFISIAQGEGDTGSINTATTEAIISQAEKLLGVPYLWGGMSSKGVDCSGLVRISHIMNGIVLPRNASQQINCGYTVPMEVSQEGDLKEEMLRRISRLERGDLVFFGTPATESSPRRVTHVGIYLGDGRFIHSSHMVRINSLIPGSPDYYENSWKLIGAVRL